MTARAWVGFDGGSLAHRCSRLPGAPRHRARCQRALDPAERRGGGRRLMEGLRKSGRDDADRETFASAVLAPPLPTLPERSIGAGGLARTPAANDGAQVLWLQRHAGNRAVATMLGGAQPARRPLARSAPPRGSSLQIARLVGAPGASAESQFNPGSIVHDLRRGDRPVRHLGGVGCPRHELRADERKVDAGLVIRVLDGLTPEQVTRVETPLRGPGEEDAPQRPPRAGSVERADANLKPDQPGADRGAAQGHRQAGERHVDARLEAIAIELHELLSGNLDDGQARARDGLPPPPGERDHRDRARTTSGATGTTRTRTSTASSRALQLNRVAPVAHGQGGGGRRPGDRGEAPRARRAAGEA